MFQCHQTWRAGNPPLIVDVPLATKHVLQRKTSFLGLIQSAMFAATGESYLISYLIYPNNQPFQAPWLSCLWCLGRLSGKRQVISFLLRDLCIYFSLLLYIYIHMYTYVHIYIYTCVCMCMYLYIYIYLIIYIYVYIYIYCIYYVHNWIFKGANISARSALWLVSSMFVHLTKNQPVPDCCPNS